MIYSIGNRNIELISSIDDPMINWIKCYKFSLMGGAIGSGLGDIKTRHEELKKHILAENKDKALKELQNLITLNSLILNEVNPDLLSFCALVRTLDGLTFNPTDSNIENLAKSLLDSGVTIKDIHDALEVKKKYKTKSTFISMVKTIISKFFNVKKI